jgi:hypothetical protein
MSLHDTKNPTGGVAVQRVMEPSNPDVHLLERVLSRENMHRRWSGSNHAIILILKQNLPKNTHFEALQGHFRAANCPCKAQGIPSVGSSHRLQSPPAL